jgi:hypothetical protein
MLSAFTRTVFGILLQSDRMRDETKPKLLIESGFECVTEMDGVKLFRKPK